MEFIESDPDGARAAILRLRSPEARCEITLLPLIEGTGRAYDEAILHELERHDVILFEPSSASESAHRGSPRSGLDLTTQQALFRDSNGASREPTPQEFGSWWSAVPSGGGPYIPTEVMELAFVPEARERRATEGLLTPNDGLRLRRLVLEPADRSIGAVVDRLLAALAARPVFVALLLSPPQLEEAAQRLRTQHGFRIFDRSRQPLSEQPSPIAPSASGRRLINQLGIRRRHNERSVTIRRILWRGLQVALIILAVAIAYFGITHWSEIRRF